MMWPLLVGASILLNGFFAGMETGITSARRVRLVHLARQGRRGAGLASELVRHRERSVVAAVVGNNVAVVTGTALATAWAVAAMGARGETVAAVAMATLNILFGEILPKTTFRARPELMVILGAWLFSLLAWVLWPLQVAATRSAQLILAVFGERGVETEEAMTRPRLLQVFAMSQEQRELGVEENRILADFVRNSQRAVTDVMRPWAEVGRVAESATVSEVFHQVRSTGHSRMPVERPDGSIRGLILYRDLQGMESSSPIGEAIRDYIRIPRTMALDEAIVVLTDRQVSMAVVVGSGRVPAGIVTLEDLLEPFMGEIEDEHDATAIPN